MSGDTMSLGQSFGNGIAWGLIIVGAVTVMVLPASYVMNKFIYHVWPMRLLLGIFVGAFSVFSFFVIAGMRILDYIKPVHYFGLLPVISMQSDTMQGTFAWLISLLIHPLQTLIDRPAYEASIQHFLVEDGSVAVNEDFFAGARGAAAEEDQDLWKTKMQGLVDGGIGDQLFWPVR